MKTQKGNIDEIRRAALPEAGHAVVAWTRGCPDVLSELLSTCTRGELGMVTYALRTISAPSGKKRRSLAVCRTKGLVDKLTYTGRTAHDWPREKLKRATIGYAGVISRILWEKFEADEYEALQLLNDGYFYPSAEDYALIGDLNPTRRLAAIRRTIRVLKKNWSEVRELTTRLSVEHVKHLHGRQPAFFKTRVHLT